MSVTETAARAEIDLSAFLARLWRGWWIVLGMALAGFVAGLLVARSMPVSYTATLKVTPAIDSPRNGSQSGLDGLAALAGGGSSNASPLDIYLASLTARRNAEVLAADPQIMHQLFPEQWDADTRRWHEPGGPGVWARNILGLPAPAWRPPDAASVQTYLDRKIKIDRAGLQNPITTVSYSNPDPVFAAALVNRLDRMADETVRREDLARARVYIAYLSGRLQSTVQADQRTAIAVLLSEQERRAMQASGSVSYAAQHLEPAPVPREPSSIKPIYVVVAGLAVGLVLGVLLALTDSSAIFRGVRLRRAQSA